MDRQAKYAASSQVILAVLAIIAALYLLRMILVPVAVALVLACMLSPMAAFFRRWFPFGPAGALALFLLLLMGGLYVASLTAEGLLRATHTLPADIERLAGQVSTRISDLARDQPYLRTVLPEPGTIDRLGDTNSALLIEKLSAGLADFTIWVVQGFIILVLVIFLLVESPMLTNKVIRFFAQTTGEVEKAGAMLTAVTRKIRDYLVARTLINLGLGLVVAMGLWCLNVHFALILGLFAALTNFIPYIGQIIGGAPAHGHRHGTDGVDRQCAARGCHVPGRVGIEGYIVTPLVMGRSLDLNGTGSDRVSFLGLSLGADRPDPGHADHGQPEAGFSNGARLNRWAELMSLDWQSPEPVPAGTSIAPGAGPVHRPLATGIGLGAAAGHTQPAEAVAAGSLKPPA